MGEVTGLGFRVRGSGFRIQGLGFRVQGVGLRVQGSGFRVEWLGFGVQRVSGQMGPLEALRGASHARSWSPWLVLGAILWAFIAKS